MRRAGSQREVDESGFGDDVEATSGLREAWETKKGLIVSDGGSKVDFGAAFAFLKGWSYKYLNEKQLREVTDDMVMSLLSDKVLFLNFAGCECLTEACIAAVAAKCPSLKALEVAGCRKLTDECIKMIALECPLLASLVVANCLEITDASIELVAANCVSLKALDVTSCQKLTDASIKAIANNCRSLLSLIVADCGNVTDLSIAAIASECAALTSLEVTGCEKVKETSIKETVRLPKDQERKIRTPPKATPKPRRPPLVRRDTPESFFFLTEDVLGADVENDTSESSLLAGGHKRARRRRGRPLSGETFFLNSMSSSRRRQKTARALRRFCSNWEDWKADLSCGLTVGVVLVPQGMAYGMLAGLNPAYGLYCGVAPLLVYGVIGGSEMLAIGPFALVSLLTLDAATSAAKIADCDVAPDSQCYVSAALALSLITGSAQVLLAMTGAAEIVAAALADSVMEGFTCAAACLIATSQLRHLVGFDDATKDAANDHAQREFPQICGVSDFAKSWLAVFVSIDSVNAWALCMGGASTLALVLLKKMKKKCKRFPEQLCVIACATLVPFLVATLGHDSPWPVVGALPSGPPPFGAKPWGLILSSNRADAKPMSAFFSLLKSGFTLAIISYALTIAIDRSLSMKKQQRAAADKKEQSLPSLENTTNAPPPRQATEAATTYSTLRDGHHASSSEEITVVVSGDDDQSGVTTPRRRPSFSRRVEDEEEDSKEDDDKKDDDEDEKKGVEPRRELAALGIANVAGSFFGAYPAAGSLSRSALALDAGAATPKHNLVAGIVVLSTLIALTPLFTKTPKAVLSAVVFVSLLSLFDTSPPKRLWERGQKRDALLWCLTCGATLLLGVEMGLGAGVFCSLLGLIYDAARPTTAILGRLDGHPGVYRDLTRRRHATHAPARPVPGVAILRYGAAVHFGNRAHFAAKVKEALKPNDVHALVVDCSAVSAFDASAEQAIADLLRDESVFGTAIQKKKLKKIMLLAVARGSLRDVIKYSPALKDLVGTIFVNLHDAVQFAEARSLPDRSSRTTPSSADDDESFLPAPVVDEDDTDFLRDADDLGSPTKLELASYERRARTPSGVFSRSDSPRDLANNTTRSDKSFSLV